MHSSLELGMFSRRSYFFIMKIVAVRSNALLYYTAIPANSYIFIYSKVTVLKIHYCFFPVCIILVIILTLGRHVFCILFIKRLSKQPER